MRKLTRVQKIHAESALSNAVRALKYLQQSDVAVCRKGGFASTTLHYTRADGSTLYEVDKGIGSDLCGLESAITDLRRLLADGE